MSTNPSSASISPNSRPQVTQSTFFKPFKMRNSSFSFLGHNVPIKVNCWASFWSNLHYIVCLREHLWDSLIVATQQDFLYSKSLIMTWWSWLKLNIGSVPLWQWKDAKWIPVSTFLHVNFDANNLRNKEMVDIFYIFYQSHSSYF